jgi:hypothetical protein
VKSTVDTYIEFNCDFSLSLCAAAGAPCKIAILIHISLFSCKACSLRSTSFGALCNLILDSSLCLLKLYLYGHDSTQPTNPHVNIAMPHTHTSTSFAFTSFKYIYMCTSSLNVHCQQKCISQSAFNEIAMHAQRSFAHFKVKLRARERSFAKRERERAFSKHLQPCHSSFSAQWVALCCKREKHTQERN